MKGVSSDAGEQEFARLIDRIIEQREVLIAGASDDGAANIVPRAVGGYSLKQFAALGTFDHLPVKATEIN
jgi:hypothetical protein